MRVATCATDGLFLQWVHVYEMTPELIATIIGAPRRELRRLRDLDAEPRRHDRGRREGQAAPPRRRAPSPIRCCARRARALQHPQRGRPARSPRRGRSGDGALLSSFGVRANSDFAPVLDLNAARARFLREQVDDIAAPDGAPHPGACALRSSPARGSPTSTRFLDWALTDGCRARAQRGMPARRNRISRTGGRRRSEAATAIAGRGPQRRCALRWCECNLAVGLAVDAARAGRGSPGWRTRISLARSAKVYGSAWSARPAHAPRVRSWLRLHSAIAGEDAGRIIRPPRHCCRTSSIPTCAPYVIAAHADRLLLGKDGEAACASPGESTQTRGPGRPTWDPVFRFLIGQAVRG